MKRFLADLKKYKEYTIYSAKSELKSETANSHLSWLWWILDPLLFMMVYSFIAIIVFSKGEKYFAAFVFIGLSSWTFFSATVKQSVKIVSKNSAIVSKVYIPKYILVLIRMFANAFKMMISYILIVGMMVLYQVPVSYRLLYVLPILLTLFTVTFGISTIMLHFGVFVEDLYNVINVLLRLMFYMSGIFYSIHNRIGGAFETILLKCNPMAFIIDSLRNSMIYNTTPDMIVLLIWFLIGCVLSMIGIGLVYKYENSYVKVI